MKRDSGDIKTLAKSFWAKVNVTGPKSCWIWTASKTQQGYGRIGNLRAHRLSWMLKYGSIPKGLDCCHTCDNEACVNPVHLFIGTRSDNVNDSVAKGRWNRPLGEKHPFAKLIPLQVLEIRQSSLSQRRLASKFNVSRAVIRQVLDNRAWKWVT